MSAILDTLTKYLPVIGAIGGGIAGVRGGGSMPDPVGYQGQVAKYGVQREALPQSGAPIGTGGVMGQRYFTDTTYNPQEGQLGTPRDLEAEAREAEDYRELLALLTGSSLSLPAGTDTFGGETKRDFEPTFVPPTATTTTGAGTTTGTGLPAGITPEMIIEYVNREGVTPQDVRREMDAAGISVAQLAGILGMDEAEVQRQYDAAGFAAGGLASLKPKGYYLGGATDGMADKIPAQIAGAQPAALSDGEFVVPADVVSHLGNGNSNAGAKQLYDMMERIRKARTGTPEQGKRVNPAQFVPK
jgi:hypothetical protein